MVFSAPNVVEPASWEMLEAVMAPVVFETPELMVKTPRRVPPPTAPLIVIVPISAVKERLLAPSTVLERRILPAPFPVVMEEFPVKLIAFANAIVVFVLVIDPLRLTDPPPL